MRTVSEIVGIQILLTSNAEQTLFILVGADGSINRLGTGTLHNSDKELFVGKADISLFHAIRAGLSDEMLQFTGGYSLPDQRGIPCVLTVALRFQDQTSDGFEFRYGTESNGPPGELAEFVRAAVRLTDPWFEEFKRMARAGKKTV